MPNPFQHLSNALAVFAAAAGAQNGDLGSQALGFLRLTPGQVGPPLFDAQHNFVGCPGVTPDQSGFNGTSCVTSAPSTIGQSYTVHFPAPGNYKLSCLVHQDMTGVIHVVNSSAALPHDQPFYGREANRQRAVLIANASGLAGPGSSAGDVTAGISAILATGAGSQTASLARFLQSQIVVRVADPRPPSQNVTVESNGARHAVLHVPRHLQLHLRSS